MDASTHRRTIVSCGSMPALTLSGCPALLATIRNITERKCAEMVLHQSEERFRRLVKQSPGRGVDL